MNKTYPYKALFGKANFASLDATRLSRIRNKVARQIERERMARARRIFGGSAIIGLGALIGFIPVIKSLFSAARISGFTSYISLVSTDSWSMLTNSSSWLNTLVESLPLLQITSVVALLLILAASLRSFVSSLSALSAHRHLNIARLVYMPHIPSHQ